jgi:hypothetical protein
MINDGFSSILEALEPEFQERFVESIYSFGSAAQFTALMDAVRTGSMTGVLGRLGYLPDYFWEVQDVVELAYGQAGQQVTENAAQAFAEYAANPQLPDRVPDMAPAAVVSFDARNPRAEQYLAERSSTLITSIENETRDNVRMALTQSMTEGRSPRTTALDLVGRINRRTGMREGGMIGLTPAQNQWANNVRTELNSDTISGLNSYLSRELRDPRFDTAVENRVLYLRHEKAMIKDRVVLGERIAEAQRRDDAAGERAMRVILAGRERRLAAMPGRRKITSAQADKMVTKYRNRTLRYRAENIARTELIGSMNHAEFESLRQMVERGEVEDHQVKRTWDATADKATRDHHASMDGQVAIGVTDRAYFTSGIRGKMMFPMDRSMGATAADAINCRCFVITDIDFGATQKDDYLSWGLDQPVPPYELRTAEWSDGAWEDYLKDETISFWPDGMTPDNVEDGLAQYLEHAVPAIQVSGNDLNSILNDRFRNQFYTNTSGGYLSHDTRDFAEAALWDIDQGAHHEERPVYGFVMDNREEEFASRLAGYGDITIKLKPEVRARTTFVFGDTLDDTSMAMASLRRVGNGPKGPVAVSSWGKPEYLPLAPSPMNDPRAWSVPFKPTGSSGANTASREFLIPLSNGDALSPPNGIDEVGYVEAQIFGEVDSGDISQIIISEMSDYHLDNDGDALLPDLFSVLEATGARPEIRIDGYPDFRAPWEEGGNDNWRKKFELKEYDANDAAGSDFPVGGDLFAWAGDGLGALDSRMDADLEDVERFVESSRYSLEATDTPGIWTGYDALDRSDVTMTWDAGSRTLEVFKLPRSGDLADVMRASSLRSDLGPVTARVTGLSGGDIYEAANAITSGNVYRDGDVWTDVGLRVRTETGARIEVIRTVEFDMATGTMTAYDRPMPDHRAFSIGGLKGTAGPGDMTDTIEHQSYGDFMAMVRDMVPTSDRYTFVKRGADSKSHGVYFYSREEGRIEVWTGGRLDRLTWGRGSYLDTDIDPIVSPVIGFPGEVTSVARMSEEDVTEYAKKLGLSAYDGDTWGYADEHVIRIGKFDDAGRFVVSEAPRILDDLYPESISIGVPDTTGDQIKQMRMDHKQVRSIVSGFVERGEFFPTADPNVFVRSWTSEGSGLIPSGEKTWTYIINPITAEMTIYKSGSIGGKDDAKSKGEIRNAMIESTYSDFGRVVSAYPSTYEEAKAEAKKSGFEFSLGEIGKIGGKIWIKADDDKTERAVWKDGRLVIMSETLEPHIWKTADPRGVPDVTGRETPIPSTLSPAEFHREIVKGAGSGSAYEYLPTADRYVWVEHRLGTDDYSTLVWEPTTWKLREYDGGGMET